MLGAKHSMAQECYEGQFVGGGWGFKIDFTGKLPEERRPFSAQFIPLFLKNYPEKSKVVAGLACGMLYTICKGMKIGDIVLCPKGEGEYWAGEVAGDYYYAEGQALPHRRKVNWYPQVIRRSDFSQGLKNSTGAIGTVSDITSHAEEIDRLIGNRVLPQIIAVNTDIEDPTAFAMEKHLEEFLVHNWHQTELGKNYEIYAEEGELVGQQYMSDTGPIDILAISKDKKELLVVELKKGRASDVVIGQIQRYMGYVKEELAEKNQTVRGVIVALEDDVRLKRALSVTNNIEFYRYQVSFKLFKG